MKKFIGLLSILFVCQFLMAQTTENPNAFTLKGIGLDYVAPVSEDYFDYNNLNYGGEIGYFRHISKGLNIGFPLRYGFANIASKNNIDSISILSDQPVASLDAVLMAKLNNGIWMKENSILAPYLFVGAGGNYFIEDENDPFDFQIPVGAGFNIRLSPLVAIQIQSEYRYSIIKENHNLVHSAGLVFSLPSSKSYRPVDAPLKDSDNDGIIDKDDRCPNEVGLSRFYGCPDKDGDGIPDYEDDCPDEVGEKDRNGCPIRDKDEDGIPDSEDKCPSRPGPASNRGCPTIADADKDGVADEKDMCPDLPGLMRFSGCPDTDADGLPDNKDQCPNLVGTSANNGCPDTDGDGITDLNDRCPTSPGPASSNGCPELTEEDKQALELAKSAVAFESGKAVLKESSFSILDKIAGIMTRYPEYNLSIEGHTDSVGDETANQLLSTKRAKSCYDYLIKKGIQASRMDYKGFGESKPIADNKFKAGRSQNRRVEFKINM